MRSYKLTDQLTSGWSGPLKIADAQPQAVGLPQVKGVEMSYCSEFVALVETIRDPAKGTEESRIGFELQSDAEDKWDEILEKYGRNSWEVVGNLQTSFRHSKLGIPWAIIAFPEEYRLAGHLCSLRVGGDDFSFTAYSVRSGYSVSESGPPPVSMVFVSRKAVLERCAHESQLFQAAWQALEKMPETRNWFCISDPPPAQWVADTEIGDDELYLSLMRS